NIWQIRKQNEKLQHGKSATSRIKAYTDSWQARCYSDGIPDEVPSKLLFSGRAPSWKAIAICLLNNDHQMQKLGMARNASKLGEEIERELKRKDTGQERLF